MMKTLRNCELYATDIKNWGNFKPVSYMDLSDFQSWAMWTAFEKMGIKSESEHNCWYWQDGKIYQENYKDNNPFELYELALTDNGVLFLSYFMMVDGDWDKKSQFRVRMK